MDMAASAGPLQGAVLSLGFAIAASQLEQGVCKFQTFRCMLLKLFMPIM